MEDKEYKKISIVIPLFNEQGSLKELNEQIIKVMSTMDYSYEIIYIDDGSTDQSFEELIKIKDDNKNIILIQFRRNFGKAAALSAGFEETTGDLVITMDADLQDEPSEIPNLINKIEEGYDLVSGWKQSRKDPFIKIISSSIFNSTISILSGIKLHDFNCGFKIYKQEVIKSIEVYGELHRFLPVLANQKGFKIGEVKISHNKRKFGESKYGKFGLRRIRNYLLDTINIFLITKYLKKPLHFFGTLGLLMFSVGFTIGLYLTTLRIFTGSIQNHTPLLMLGILLIIIGTQLVSLGLLGEIIVKFNQKREDIYNIKKKLR